MKCFSFQHVQKKNTWAVTIFFMWVASTGIIINHTSGRTDIFFTLGVLPFSFSFSFGLTYA